MSIWTKIRNKYKKISIKDQIFRALFAVIVNALAINKLQIILGAYGAEDYLYITEYQ